MKFPQSAQSRNHLIAADPQLAPIIEEVGPIRIELDPEETIFESLVTSIVYQQLHGKAAAAILGRFKALWNDTLFPTASQVLEQSEETLRTTGLSRTKILSMKDLSQKTLNGSLPERSHVNQLNDKDLMEVLVQVRGVGPWTAQMLMIFTLGRTDILPTGDYGVKKGYAAVYGKKKIPSPQELEKAAEKWRPFRSAASWYLWQALELERYKNIKIEK